MSLTVSQYPEEDLIDLAVASPAPDPTVIEGAVAFRAGLPAPGSWLAAAAL